MKFKGGILLIIITAIFTFGWGGAIHKVVNSNMVLHLPAELAGFIDRAQLLEDSSSVPDWRKYGSYGYPVDPNEPDHFIDADFYPEFATHTLTTNLDSLIMQYGETEVMQQGIVPWVIVWTTDSLSAQMQRHEWTKVWSTAACLGHYVADIHCPMHATMNYNGQLTGQTGIHSRYEGYMFTDPVLDDISVSPESVSYLSNPIDDIFNRMYQSNSYVDSILNADLDARALDPGYGDIYNAALWNSTQHFTKLQIQRASITFANLIYTAWINAGSPYVPRATDAIFDVVSTPAQNDSVGIELTKTSNIIVSNTGASQLEITSVSSSNGVFMVSPSAASIAVNGTQTFLVSYTPTSVGKDSAYIRFNHNAGSNDSVKVSGVGLEVMQLNNARNLPDGSLIVFDGIVTRVKGSYTFLQDDYAGMVLYQQPGNWWRDSTDAGKVTKGMKLRVMGRTSQYNQLMEIKNSDLLVTKILSNSNPIPAAKAVTLSQISTAGEQYEACLVKIVDLDISFGSDLVIQAAKTYYIADYTDNTNAVILRIPNASDSDVDGKSTASLNAFIGMVNQFDYSNPSAGYQLMPIDSSDITTTEALPVELINFSATVSVNGVKLKWQTATELNNYGFEIERTSKNSAKDVGIWKKIDFVKGSGNSNSTKNYSFIDTKVSNGKYLYRLKQIDASGKFEYSKEIEVNVNTLPKDFTLYQNYPNPFNPTTTFSYDLPRNSNVQLIIYDALGKIVKEFVYNSQSAGKQKLEWNGTNNYGQKVSSGIYLFHFKASASEGKLEVFEKSAKLILMK